ncbi:hypothetical protein MCHIJ_50020 [Mycolicibacterium chitae]|uniref:ESX-1 secretion-associated protein n=1 Tax=Mycolicibacterium chitae TaxID=1792 RepID=A0A448I9U1_MYCCI|nr:type VII secretion target [Mycolicibacterium chitae]MCV7107847.1 hypothetical protein [Mycolicibacterium chitae]BBZ05565.1 hypothetical protein MCHIJ_50020 [Mycolicibacterium chitae]VEG49178.1 Uncharacterised protein [Mycolicibacterium chitae]
MADPGSLSMTPSDVIYSADYLDSIGAAAGAERRALAVELSAHDAAWQDRARPGFVAFGDTVHRQGRRAESELADVADKLRLAAREYVATALAGAEALRYHRGPSPL